MLWTPPRSLQLRGKIGELVRLGRLGVTSHPLRETHLMSISIPEIGSAHFTGSRVVFSVSTGPLADAYARLVRRTDRCPRPGDRLYADEACPLEPVRKVPRVIDLVRRLEHSVRERVPLGAVEVLGNKSEGRGRMSARSTCGRGVEERSDTHDDAEVHV